MRLDQYDFIQTPDEIVSLVLGQHNNHIVVHPKYMVSGKKTPWQFLEKSWDRVANPLAPTRTNTSNWSAFLTSYGEQDYLCKPTEITKRFNAVEAARKLVLNDSSNPHLSRIRQLLLALAPIVPNNQVGITGGAALGFGVEGFSDIDLVIGQQAYAAFAANVETIPDVHLRTRSEWTQFYSQYTIMSHVTADEFAGQMLRKRTQFIYDGVPTSVFVAPADLPELAPYSKGENAQTLEGVVIDDSDAILLPAQYVMQCGERTIRLQSRDRTAIELARIGERVRARGAAFPNSSSLLIRPGTTDTLEVMQ